MSTVELRLIGGGLERPAPIELASRSRKGGPRSSGQTSGSSQPQRVRIADAASRCISRRGVSKTTVDDIAREAGCSRATVYRSFAGGKDEVVAAVVDTEVARLFSSLAVSMGSADDLEDAIVAGVVGLATAIQEHRALQFVLENEPEIILPYLCFEPLGRVLEEAANFAVAFLARFIDPDTAKNVAESAARIALSYIATPAPGIDLRVETTARRVVSTFVMPATGRLPADSSPHALQNDPRMTDFQTKGEWR
jgi:AcrR family transcriptional regulator